MTKHRFCSETIYEYDIWLQSNPLNDSVILVIKNRANWQLNQYILLNKHTKMGIEVCVFAQLLWHPMQCSSNVAVAFVPSSNFQEGTRRRLIIFRKRGHPYMTPTKLMGYIIHPSLFVCILYWSTVQSPMTYVDARDRGCAKMFRQ